ncbi:MAG: zf-HC2 domain-containing protein, partial [Vicinamibacterales bacterium]
MNDVHEQIIDQLSEYVDGELATPLRAELERHIVACTECRVLVDELRQVKARAATLPNTPPRLDLWDGLTERISQGGRGRVLPLQRRAPRRFSFTVPQLAAAGVALMLMSGSLVWVAQKGNARADFPAVGATATAPGSVAPSVEPRVENASSVDAHYEGAVEDLEKTLDQGREQLDPETVRVLEQNLETIDQAIDQ